MTRSQEWSDGWITGAMAMAVLLTSNDRARWEELRDEFLAAPRPTTDEGRGT